MTGVLGVGKSRLLGQALSLAGARWWTLAEAPDDRWPPFYARWILESLEE